MSTLETGVERMPTRSDFPYHRVGKEVVVQDPSQGTVHFLNATAAVVWDCCDGATTLEECGDRLRERFAIPASLDLLADIRAVLADFQQRGILRAGGTEPAQSDAA